MTVYGGPPSDPSRWPDDRDQPPHDQPPSAGQGYGPPGHDPRRAAEPGTAAWGADAGAAAWGGDGGRGAEPVTEAWRGDPRSGDPRGAELRGGDFRAGPPSGDVRGGDVRGGDVRGGPPPGRSAWAPEDTRSGQPAGPDFGGSSPARGSASLFDPSHGAGARGAASPSAPSFDAAPPARGAAQPTASLFDTGERATGQVRGSARPTGGTYGAAPVPGADPTRDRDPQGTGAFRDGEQPATGTFRDGQPPAARAFREPNSQATGTFRDAELQGTGALHEGAPPAFREPNPQATGTFRDAELQGTGAFRDGPPPAAGAFRDGDPQGRGAVRGGAAGGAMFAAGAPVAGPAYGDGPAYGEGPGYSEGSSGSAFGTGQVTGPVYGAQAAGPVYGATRAPDPGATRGPEDLFAAQAYQPEERAGRRKLPLPGEPPAGRSGGGRRTAIILGAIAALVIGAGTAGAATFLNGDDPAPGKSQPPVAQQGTEAATPGGTTAPAAAGAGKEVTMTATGDIVMGMAPGGLPPNNGKGFFEPVRQFLTADFQMGNLEQVLTDDTGVGKCSADTAGKTCFAFRTPPGYVSNLKDAGFRMMNMANNHAYDFGEVGYKNSQKALDGAGIKYTGWPGMVSVGEAKGLKIAVVGFASYKWSNLCSDLDAAETIIKEAASKADLVVVQVHQGAEGSDKTHTKPGTEFFLGENRCDTIAFAHKVIDAGADLVVGHGPHVMRAMEFYKGRLIAYSLGNFAGYKALSYNGTVGIGGVLKVTLGGDGAYKSGSLTATYMVAPGLPKPDPKKQAIPFVSNLTKQDFPTTGAKIAADGTITQPAGG